MRGLLEHAFPRLAPLARREVSHGRSRARDSRLVTSYIEVVGRDTVRLVGTLVAEMFLGGFTVWRESGALR
jgi:hypothetical protein